MGIIWVALIHYDLSGVSQRLQDCIDSHIRIDCLIENDEYDLNLLGHIMMPTGQSLGSSNLPFRGAKCTLYEGGVRTPAFIKIPHEG